MRFYLHPLCLVLLAILATDPGPIPFARASSGDRSAEFQRCLAKCLRNNCITADGNGHRRDVPRSLALRLTRWTCADECKYACAHAVTDLAVESGVRLEQFYGKWAFWRLAGMQEPASVAFSVANLLVHVLGADWLRRGVHPAHPMRPFYLTWSYVSINAWAWSAVFHTRGAFLFFFGCSSCLFTSSPPSVSLMFPNSPTHPVHPITPLFHAGRSRGVNLTFLSVLLMYRKRVFD
jgi:hypothetical protein